MHMDSCMRTYSNVQQILCHRSYCELILSLARTSCRLLSAARPDARPLAGNPLRDAVCSRNLSKYTLAHDAVANAVLTSIIWSSALVQASSSLSVGCTCTWPRRLPVTEMHFCHFRASFLPWPETSLAPADLQNKLIWFYLKIWKFWRELGTKHLLNEAKN